MNDAPLNSIPLNGSLENTDCQGSGALNDHGLNEVELGGGGGCSTSSSVGFVSGYCGVQLRLRTINRNVAVCPLLLQAYTSAECSATLSLSTSAKSGFAAFLPRLRTVATGNAVCGLALSAGQTIGSGSATAPLTLRRYNRGIATTASFSGGLHLSCFNPIIIAPTPPGSVPPAGSIGGDYYHFTVIVSVGQMTLPATGTVEIDAEENGARTANLVIQGDPEIDPGDVLTITLRVDGASTRIYRGIVDTVDYSPDSDETKLSCTDELQQYVDQLTNAQIDAITPGALTTPGNTDKGFAYLNHRLQTMTSSVYRAQDGSFTVQSWIPDINGKTIDRTIYGTTTQSRRGLSRKNPASTATPQKRTEYLITLNFSWVRIAKAVVKNQWLDRFDFCDYLQSGSVSLPQPQSIIDAVNNTGWHVDQLDIQTFTPHSGWVSCGGNPIGVIVDGDNSLAVSAAWSLSQRYTRSMQATMSLRVIPADADPAAPVELVERSMTIKDPRDGKDWLDFGTGTLINQDSNGDFYADLIDLGDAQNQMGTQLDPISREIINARAQLAYELAVTAANAAQDRRGERLSTSTPIRPDLDIGQTGTIVHEKLTGTGVITSVHHRIDIDAGDGTTAVEIAPYVPSSQTTLPPQSADYPPDNIVEINTTKNPGQSTAEVDIVALINHTPAMGNGSASGGGALSKITTRIPPTDDEDVMRIEAQPQTYRGGTPAVVMPESELWQGYVYNAPQSAIYVAGGPMPRFYPEYQNPGFFVRVPPINLPDQTEPINLGESLVVI